jgi:XapX domain-containing protein
VKIAIGFVLAAGIGIMCRLAGIPLPAPPAVVGALLVLSMTSGYLLTDRYLRRSGPGPIPDASQED